LDNLDKNMRITIDTRVDSAEDIRKAIAFLSSLSDRSYSRIEKSSNIFDDSSPSLGSAPEPSQPAANAFSNMFGSSEMSAPADNETKSSYLETPQEKEEDKSYRNIHVIPY
jgi:hypothetical protein